jgi:hypothetical protein
VASLGHIVLQLTIIMDNSNLISVIRAIHIEAAVTVVVVARLVRRRDVVDLRTTTRVGTTTVAQVTPSLIRTREEEGEDAAREAAA